MFYIIQNMIFYCSFDEVFRLLGQRQKGVIARSILFRPGGPLACELARHGVALKVNDWVFCHGGLLPHHGQYFTVLLVLFNIILNSNIVMITILNCIWIEIF